MKLIRVTLLLLLLGPAAVGIAWADHFYGPRVGVYVGAGPWPLYYPGPGYYPYPNYPVIVTAPAPTVYVEQDPSSASGAPAYRQPTAPSSDWYYCHNPEGYYPYVKNCPAGWQRVPSQPVIPH